MSLDQLFPSPRGDKLQLRKIYSYFRSVAFPSPRGDKLQPC